MRRRSFTARIGNARAVTPTARKIAALFCITLRYSMEYVDCGTAYYEECYRQRVLNNLTRRAESLRYVLQAKQPDTLTLKSRRWTSPWFFEPPDPDVPAPRPPRHTAD